MRPFCASHFAGSFSHTQTSDCSHSSTADQQRTQLQSASHESVCLVPEWTSICLCLIAIFGQATTYVRAFYSADIGITTATTSDVSSTCIVLALVAGRQDCQPYPNTVSQQQTLHICFSATVKSAVLLTIAVNMTCGCMSLHFNALSGLTQTCLTAYLTQYLHGSRHFTRLCISVHFCGKCI